MSPDTRFTIEGHDLGYPTSFRDGSSINATFAVPAGVATALIADTGFRPARVLPRRAVLSLNCVHYVDTDCGTYDEIALALLVDDPARSAAPTGLTFRLPGWRTWSSLLGGTIGAHSWRLGVSTTLSRDCGLQMWGFPKVVGDLEFSRAGDRAQMSWVQDGELVLAYGAPATGGRSPKPIAPAVYSIHHGAPHVAHLTQRYAGVGYHLRGGAIELGPHHYADDLRALGLPRRPLVSVWNEHLEFEMSEPRPLGGRGAGRG